MLLTKAPVLPKETKQLSEEEIRSGTAGDNETHEEAQDFGQRERSRAAHQHQKSQQGTGQGCRDCWGDKRSHQTIKQEE